MIEPVPVDLEQIALAHLAGEEVGAAHQVIVEEDRRPLGVAGKAGVDDPLVLAASLVQRAGGRRGAAVALAAEITFLARRDHQQLRMIPLCLEMQHL